MFSPVSTSNSSSIQVHEVGKYFQIYSNSGDRLKQLFSGKRRRYFHEFWAIRNVSFELCKGSSLGIVGRNGSGKSTLLQMICGMIRPSEGYIHTNGRIAALLELGSGFNPEFTGVENIFLNASLLGLSRRETELKLDDILGFADIGDFVNQPVKTYSSGMAVRLAFSVVAHVEADILIVDEALAVGDAYFTQKCMRFIQRHREDNCLLFVSHDASAVMSLCDNAMLLEDGTLKKIGTPKQVITEYMKSLHDENSSYIGIVPQSSVNILETVQPQQCESTEGLAAEQIVNVDKWSDYRSELVNSNLLTICRFEESVLTSESFGTGKAEIVNVCLLNDSTKLPLIVALGGEIITLRIEACAKSYIEKPIAGFILKNDKGLTLLGDNTLNAYPPIESVPLHVAGILIAEFRFTLPLLPVGTYSITASIAEGTQNDHSLLHWLNDAIVLRSECNNIAAGLAGVAMHHIKLTVNCET